MVCGAARREEAVRGLGGVVNVGVVRHDLLSFLASLSVWRSSGQKLCPGPRVCADDDGVYGRRAPPWRHYRGTLLSFLMSGSRAHWVKTQASVSRSGRRWRHCHFSLMGVTLVSRLWRLCAASLALGLVDTGTTVPDGGERRGGGLEIHDGEELHGAELLPKWFGS